MNENLDHLSLPNPNILTHKYSLENGKIVNDKQFTELLKKTQIDKTKIPLVCSKEVYNTDTKLSSYYILCAGGQMYDPTNTDARYKKRNTWKFRKVNKTTYNSYTKFLTTRHKTFLYQAERNI